MTNFPAESPRAWLEDADHKRTPIQGSCSIGRLASNHLALPSDKISRRHALIQIQGEHEYWLVDFGSRNGTYLNGRRIIQPALLHHEDRLVIGPFEFIFHTPRPADCRENETIDTGTTVTDIRLAKCWLLVADIIGSTRLLKELPLDEVPVITGRWVAECKQTIEEHGGRINQFMGDGFFAYWRDHEGAAVMLGKALQSLYRLQEQARPGFRLVAHYGGVVIGGLSLGEEERISGGEVHLVFRMEKLAAKLGQARLLSQAAWERLAALVEGRTVGRYILPGFSSEVPMYAFTPCVGLASRLLNEQSSQASEILMPPKSAGPEWGSSRVVE
jgi:adenylate cyclase